VRVTIIAGEASGDVYGAELARALRELEPDVAVCGLGGPRMRRAGVTLLRDTGACGAIGVVNAAKVAPRALLAYAALKRYLRAQPPDVMVPIDFGAFNVRAGRFARGLGIPVYYFIAPGSWRKEGPVSPALLAAADAYCAQLPWYAERLRAAGARAEFFGHPLLDLARPSAPAAELRRGWGLGDDAPVLALFPGSRRHEVEHVLPALLDAGARIGEAVPGARFVMGLAEVVDPRQVARIVRACGWGARVAPGDAARIERGNGRVGEWESGRVGEWESGGSRPPTLPFPHSPVRPEVLVATGRTYDCLSVASAAVTCSGTVTLEAAIMGVPQVIVYRGSFGMRLQYAFVKHRIKYVGLPNLLLDAPVCPELLADAATPERIAAEALPLVKGEAPAARQREAVRRLGDMLGQPGAIRRAAERIVAMGRAGRGQ